MPILLQVDVRFTTHNFEFSSHLALLASQFDAYIVIQHTFCLGPCLPEVYLVFDQMLISLSPTIAMTGLRNMSMLHSHDSVCRTPATLRHSPPDILSRILYITGLAVQAVLRIDLQPLTAMLIRSILIDTCSHSLSGLSAINSRQGASLSGRAKLSI